MATKSKKRGPGRPKGTARRAFSIVHSRVAPLLKVKMQSEAKELGISDTQNLERIIAKHYKVTWPIMGSTAKIPETSPLLRAPTSSPAPIEG